MGFDKEVGGEQKEDEEMTRLESFRAAVRQASGVAPGLPPGAEYVRALRDNDRERLESSRAADGPRHVGPGRRPPR